MKVLLFSQPGQGKGGVETVVEKLKEGLQKKDCEVTTVYQERDLDAGSVKETCNGIKIGLRLPPTWKGFLRPTLFYRSVTSLFKLFGLLQKIKPDVVNYHYCTPGAIFFLLLRPLFGYRLIVSFHGSDVLNTQGVRPQMMPLILESADAVTCVSDDLGRRLKEQFPGRYTPKTVYNGIDLDFWSSKFSTTSRCSEHGNPLIVSVGSLSNIKGHDVLIKAFPEVRARYPDANLLLIGEGPNRIQYEALVRSAGLSGSVEFTGWLSAEAVRTKLRQASLFVFPSRHEGFGLALVEAMAAGLPVVASNVGGIPEVVGKAGVLVPPDSPHALSEAICHVLRDELEQKRALVHDRARYFAWENTIKQYKQLICKK